MMKPGVASRIRSCQCGRERGVVEQNCQIGRPWKWDPAWTGSVGPRDRGLVYFRAPALLGVFPTLKPSLGFLQSLEPFPFELRVLIGTSLAEQVGGRFQLQPRFPARSNQSFHGLLATLALGQRIELGSLLGI